MGLPSKRSGWLHTLRSCMSTLRRPMKLPLVKRGLDLRRAGHEVLVQLALPLRQLAAARCARTWGAAAFQRRTSGAAVGRGAARRGAAPTTSWFAAPPPPAPPGPVPTPGPPSSSPCLCLCLPLCLEPIGALLVGPWCTPRRGLRWGCRTSRGSRCATGRRAA